MQIVGCINIDCGTSNRNFILSFFRDSTCIGVTTKNFVSTRRPDTFPFVITDLNMGASFGSTIIYSVRVGLNTSGTWYINRMKSPVFNNMLNSNSIIFSEYL